jgi:hypothetical protein
VPDGVSESGTVTQADPLYLSRQTRFMLVGATEWPICTPGLITAKVLMTAPNGGSARSSHPLVCRAGWPPATCAETPA